MDEVEDKETEWRRDLNTTLRHYLSDASKRLHPVLITVKPRLYSSHRHFITATTLQQHHQMARRPGLLDDVDMWLLSRVVWPNRCPEAVTPG